VTETFVLAVLGVGTLAGLDLVSVPQAMLARPLVAGFLGGVAGGRPLAGLATGALLELFAFETLPLGAARYPDWGPAAAAAGALAALRGRAWDSAWMVGVMVVALLAAWLGGQTMHLARRLNGAQLRRRQGALDAGDPRALLAVQWGGLVRDALRAAALTGLTLFVGDRVARAVEAGWHAPRPLADIAVVGTALGVAVWSAVRLFGLGAPRRWLGVGALAGVTMLAVAMRW
jgi:mannose/fructose/N-acetylgalactosamine-specific phosphotransferase system component IIC